MSHEIATIPTCRGELRITEFAAGNGKTGLQLSQGFGTQVGPDEPGFIQLVEGDVPRVLQTLLDYVKGKL